VKNTNFGFLNVYLSGAYENGKVVNVKSSDKNILKAEWTKDGFIERDMAIIQTVSFARHTLNNTFLSCIANSVTSVTHFWFG